MITSSNLAIWPNLHAGRFGYLGGTRHANLGDDAIREVLRASLPRSEFLDVPPYARQLMQVARNGGLPGLRTARLLLGGGTVIGRTNWRAHVLLGMRLCRGGPALLIGVGVEEPSFPGRRSFSSFGELKRWRSVLKRFDHVTVRGPRSAALLADVGIDATIVGDPALLFAPLPGQAREHGRVGVALGAGDSLRGGDQAAVDSAVAGALRHLHLAGHSLTMFVLNPSDRRRGERCIAEAGLVEDGRVVRMVATADPSTFCTQVSTCEAMIAQRLHAGILAAACATLPVMLASQPKVDDFMASIGELRWSTPTDRLRGAAIAEQVVNRIGDAAAHRHALREHVDVLRAAQATVIGSIGVFQPPLRAVATEWLSPEADAATP